jgi:hypothetical protein
MESCRIRVGMVATDLVEHCRAGLSPGLDHARRVAVPLHAVRVAKLVPGPGAPAGAEQTLGHRAARVTRCVGSASCCRRNHLAQTDPTAAHRCPVSYANA